MKHMWIASLGVACLCSVNTAFADEDQPDARPTNGIEDIIVTAQKRAENLQSTPIAITAYTSEALTAMPARPAQKRTRLHDGWGYTSRKMRSEISAMPGGMVKI